MEGPPAVVVAESDDGMGREPFLLMLYVMPVMFLVWVLSSFGVKSLLACAVFFGYLYWINKQLWESEKQRIQFEERKKINAKRAMNGGETLRWLNDGLKAMWPICMEKFASQHFFKPMAPWFLNKYKPKFVKEVTLLSLHLGDRPPEFHLIRVLPASQDGDHVVFVAAMEFLSDKDMNAQMTVQMRGFKTTFYISRLCVKGTVKFSVKFVKGWPVLGRVRFSFENTPIVNMTARPYNKNGIDMRIIPGAASWLEETLGTALEQSVVEPYMLVIDMEKLVSNTLFPARPPQAPEDFFCVEHKSGFSPTVLVEILEAGELKAANGAGLPDPSVEVMLGSHKEKTKTIAKTTNPTWANEVQRIPIVNWELPNLLTMRVISKPKTSFGRQIELGICSISVKEYRDGSRHVETIPLSNVQTGWLRFAITVDHLNNHHAQVAEKPHSNVGSQPTTQDIHTVSPPDSASTRHHTRNSSTETLPHASEDEPGGGDGTSEVIKMPYGGDGAFSIQCPGQEKPLEFPDPQARKSKESQRSSKERDSDSKVKWSIKGLKSRKRSTSNVSSSEREMKFGEHAGYTSSLDRSTELKVCRGALKMDLELSPDMPHSRDAPDVEPLKLETCQKGEPLNVKTCQNMESLKLETCQTVQPPKLETCQNPIKTQLGPSETDTKDSSVRKEVKSSSKVPEKVQNSKKISWWKRLRPRKRKGGSSSKEPDFQAGCETFEVMSDTSASQSFRKEPDEATLKMVGHFEESGGNILVSGGRSQSCRQDPSHVKRIVWPSFSGATSLRFDPSSSFLNTIHERPQTLVP